MANPTTFRFNKKFLERMDTEAEKRGLTRTTFVRIAIENEIMRSQKNLGNVTGKQVRKEV